MIANPTNAFCEKCEAMLLHGPLCANCFYINIETDWYINEH